MNRRHTSRKTPPLLCRPPAHRATLSAAGAAALLAASPSAYADTFTWIGPDLVFDYNGAFQDPAVWDAVAVPGAADEAVFDLNVTGTIDMANGGAGTQLDRLSLYFGLPIFDLATETTLIGAGMTVAENFDDGGLTATFTNGTFNSQLQIGNQSTVIFDGAAIGPVTGNIWGLIDGSSYANVSILGSAEMFGMTDADDVQVGLDGFGALAIEGSGAKLTAIDNLIVGGNRDSGNTALNGSLYVRDGALLETNSLVVGSLINTSGGGDQGYAQVTDEGTQVTVATSTIVGDAPGGDNGGGIGTLDVDSTATFDGASLTAGNAVGSTGYVNVLNNATATFTGNAIFGLQGYGSLNVSSGGTFSADQIFVGDLEGSSGDASVSGNGEIAARNLEAGRENATTGSVTNGSYGTIDVADSFALGVFEGSMGSFIASDRSTTLVGTRDATDTTPSGWFFIGRSGTGEASISPGAYIQTTLTAIGELSSGVGTVTQEGGTWENTHNVFVGFSGVGTLDMTGGSLTTGGLAIARTVAGSGTVTVENATITINGTIDGFNELRVGRNGTGSLTVGEGGIVEVSASQATRIGVNGGSNGTFTVLNGGSATLARVDIGSFVNTEDSQTAPGTGSVVIHTGGTVTATQVEVGGNGSLRVDGLLTADGVTVTGGFVSGTGEINGPLTFDGGGTLAPGNSPGILTISDTLTFDASSFAVFELAGLLPDEFDQILTQTAFLDGTLVVSIEPAFAATLAPGDSFTIFSASLSITGQFTNVIEIDGEFRVITQDGLGSFQVVQTPMSYTLTDYGAVPEPATWATLGGLAALAAAALRRRSR